MGFDRKILDRTVEHIPEGESLREDSRVRLARFVFQFHFKFVAAVVSVSHLSIVPQGGLQSLGVVYFVGSICLDV